MIPPASSFLCCFSLETGAKLITLFHLATCCYTCGMAIGTVCLSLPQYGYATSSGMQFFTAMWSLAGIPIVLLGLWGVYHKLEPNVRIYLYFLVASVLIDTWFTADLFLMKDACVQLELTSNLSEGRAFACGVARATNMTAFAIFTAVVAYMAYIVWSFCEELSCTGISDVIGGLFASCEDRKDYSGDYFENGGGGVTDYAAIERSIIRSGVPPGRLGKLGAYMA